MMTQIELLDKNDSISRTLYASTHTDVAEKNIEESR